MSGLWPNLFVVGASKAGTTSLWRYLGQHPEIFMSRIKEPHFFSGYRSRLFPSIHDERSYLALFAGANGAKLRGEASPSYLWHEAAPSAIRRVSPDAKIVISLREPGERAWSGYWHGVRNGIERRPFVEVIRVQLGEPLSVGPAGLARGLYAAQVARYLDAFPGSVIVLFFEEFVADPGGGLRRLFGFLGVDADAADRIDLRPHNPSALPKNALSARIHGSPTARRVARALVPLPLRARIDGLLLERTQKPPMPAQARTLLTELYRDDVARLARVLGRDVPWPLYAQADACER